MSRYKHKITRDLEWLIGSKPLLNSSLSTKAPSPNWCKDELDRHHKMLQKIDRKPPVIQERRFLGSYFEQLFLIWMNNSPHYEMILNNVQVSDEVRTLSEIDFVVRDVDTKRLYHFETAVKIYMGYGDTSQLINWIGPNAQDSFQAKIQKALDKQLSIFETEAGMRLLERHKLETPHPVFFIKGHLHHEHATIKPTPQPIAKDIVSNKWIHVSKINTVNGKNDYWTILPKTYWLTPAYLLPGELPIRRWVEIQKYTAPKVNHQNHSILLAALSKVDGVFIEKYRLMLLPDNWPKIR